MYGFLVTNPQISPPCQGIDGNYGKLMVYESSFLSPLVDYVKSAHLSNQDPQPLLSPLSPSTEALWCDEKWDVVNDLTESERLVFKPPSLYCECSIGPFFWDESILASRCERCMLPVECPWAEYPPYIHLPAQM